MQYIVNAIPTILAAGSFVFVVVLFRNFVNKSLEEYNENGNGPVIQERSYFETWKSDTIANPIYSHMPGNNYNYQD